MYAIRGLAARARAAGSEQRRPPPSRALMISVLLAAACCVTTGSSTASIGAGRVSRSPPPPSAAMPTVFNSTFSDFAVLQAEPARASVYGVAGTPTGANGSQKISVTLASAGFASIPGEVTVSPDGLWVAYFPPQPAGGDYTVTAECTNGCKNATAAVIKFLTFGDVWYCAGQSNSE